MEQYAYLQRVLRDVDKVHDKNYRDEQTVRHDDDVDDDDPRYI